MLGGIIFQMSKSPYFRVCAIPPNECPVAITAYVGLASEFFTRFFTQKPLHKPQPRIPLDIEDAKLTDPNASYLSVYSFAESRMVVGVELDTRMKLMIGGLAFSTLVIFIR
jgi:hypothetical protein